MTFHWANTQLGWRHLLRRSTARTAFALVAIITTVLVIGTSSGGLHRGLQDVRSRIAHSHLGGVSHALVGRTP